MQGEKKKYRETGTGEEGESRHEERQGLKVRIGMKERKKEGKGQRTGTKRRSML